MKLPLNNKKLTIIAVALIAIALLFIIQNPLDLRSGGSISYEPTSHPDITMWLGCSETTTRFEANDDVLEGGWDHSNDGTCFATSWYSNEESQTITIDTGSSIATWPYMDIDHQGGNFGPFFQRWYWEVSYTEDTGGTTILIGKNGVLKPTMITVTNGLENLGLQPFVYADREYGAAIIDVCDDDGVWYRCEQGTGHYGKVYLGNKDFSFVLKGAHDGTLRVTAINEAFAWSDDCWGLCGSECDHCRDSNYIFYEEARLNSADGDITIIHNPDPPGGLSYEEGQTMKMYLTTDWAGTVDNGWILKFYHPTTNQPVEVNGRIYGNDGEVLYDTTYSGYRFGNELDEYIVNWDIGIGTYDPEGLNEWTIKLFNSKTGVHKTDVQVIIKDGHKLVPGPTTAKFDKPVDDYIVGDTVVMTCTAEANMNTDIGATGEITHFRVKITEEYNSGDEIADLYKYGEDVTHIGNNVYEAVFEYKIVKSDELYIRAMAYDKDPENGGMHGYADEISFAPANNGSQHDNTVRLKVVDANTNAPIHKASVWCDDGSAPQTTNVNGEVMFGFLNAGNYTFVITKDKYIQQTKKIHVESNEPPITIKLVPILNAFPIVVATIIIAVAALLAYYLPFIMTADIRMRILVAALGVVLAIIVYLYMVGYFIFSL